MASLEYPLFEETSHFRGWNKFLYLYASKNKETHIIRAFPSSKSS